jgi:hypothetical protein
MPPKASWPSWATPSFIIASVTLVTMLLALVGFVRASDFQDYKKEQQVYLRTIERKLDCALWDLPKNCRTTMSPRGE